VYNESFIGGKKNIGIGQSETNQLFRSFFQPTLVKLNLTYKKNEQTVIEKGYVQFVGYLCYVDEKLNEIEAKKKQQILKLPKDSLNSVYQLEVTKMEVHALKDTSTLMDPQDPVLQVCIAGQKSDTKR
jgi:hypothetical protein